MSTTEEQNSTEEEPAKEIGFFGAALLLFSPLLAVVLFVVFSAWRSGSFDGFEGVLTILTVLGIIALLVTVFAVVELIGSALFRHPDAKSDRGFWFRVIFGGVASLVAIFVIFVSLALWGFSQDQEVHTSENRSGTVFLTEDAWRADFRVVARRGDTPIDIADVLVLFSADREDDPDVGSIRVIQEGTGDGIVAFAATRLSGEPVEVNWNMEIHADGDVPLTLTVQPIDTDG